MKTLLLRMAIIMVQPARGPRPEEIEEGWQVKLLAIKSHTI
ncbi:hypothetical protein [Paucibacter sp. M5-1]|nr:hypothetical protein [Paucibacter sp. M5-1]MCZ7882757.1 hypothetical protein [Paucibacter sp. M5-1]